MKASTTTSSRLSLPVVSIIGPDQVAIDGVVYDLKEFYSQHPGGAEALSLWVGNDVTVPYRMIHPFHQTAQGDVHRFLSRRLKPIGYLKLSQQHQE